MEQYTVLQFFTDGETGIAYQIGDLYPKLPTDARIAALLGTEHPNHSGALIAKRPTDADTIAAIKEYLTALAVKFDDKAKKADLLALVK